MSPSRLESRSGTPTAPCPTGSFRPFAVALIAFALYSVWVVFGNRGGRHGPYRSPFYSPEISVRLGGFLVPPALWVAWAPLAFRATGYYYRKAYFRSFFWHPRSCAAPEPQARGNGYRGETGFGALNNALATGALTADWSSTRPGRCCWRPAEPDASTGSRPTPGKCTGDGTALAYRAGAELTDCEMVQLHPTGMVWPAGVRGILVTEGVRGEGGLLRNKDGERFMERYDPERMELSTLDIVARAINSEVLAGRGTTHGGAFLDISHRKPD